MEATSVERIGRLRTATTRTIGGKLAGGFGLVVAVLVIALGVDLALSGSSTSQWRSALEWDKAITAAND
jgi:hypothetical protein